MTTDTTAFDKAYKILNTEQKKAVDTIDGPVMVVAGPGTGKTQILTLRIANILKQTDAKPENILAITFTDAGTKAMRKRLRSLVGDAAYEVRITTFHAFADGLISSYPEAYEKVIGGSAASEIERINIIEKILTDTQFKAVRPGGDPSYYVRPLLGAIQDLKQENISPDSFGQRILEQEKALDQIERYHEKGAHKGKERGEYKDALKFVERNRELLQVYRRYEQLMKECRLYDFDDMILETVKALESNEDMLRDLQEKYQYVLADEHQDVNGAQNRIIELLVSYHDNPNIFVVGDEKQAIYRFQGASLENFLYFEDLFPDATLISLTNNYRSGQNILDAATDLIATEDPELQSLRVPLQAAAVQDSTVEIASFSHTAVEQSWIVSQIQGEIESGVSPDEIAVIVRTNREVENMTTLLRKQGVSVAPSADGDILEHPILRSVELLLQSVVEIQSDHIFSRLLHEPYWKFAAADVAKVFMARTREKRIADIVSDKERLAEIGVAPDSALYEFTETLFGIKKRTSTTPPHRLVELLVVESGLLSHVLEIDPEEGARVLRRLYDEVERMVEKKEVSTLADVLAQLQLHRQHGVPLLAPYISYGSTSVHVTTAHKAKGLEYESVYVPSTVDSVWGGKKSRRLFDLPILRYDTKRIDLAEEDERRLFYVAMTRAKKKLVLTSANTGVSGKEQVVSRFIGDLPEKSINELDTNTYTDSFSPIESLTGHIPVPDAAPLLRDTLEKRGLSPTALNNYLASPWEYFFKNVLRVPQVKTTELQFGTAVHGVLDELVRFQKDEDVDAWLSTVPERLKKALSSEAISEDEYVRLHERGLNALAAYIPKARSSVSSAARTEYQVEASLETGIADFPEVRLVGNLDRLDFEGGKVIRVVDYKTGKPKTRNVIEGKTAASNGDYKRQLTFYALLLSLQNNTDMHCGTGVISFVEPDKNGEIKEEQFEITPDEVAELRAEILSAVEQIVTGKMLQSPCDPESCRYCDLVSLWVR